MGGNFAPYDSRPYYDGSYAPQYSVPYYEPSYVETSYNSGQYYNDYAGYGGDSGYYNFYTPAGYSYAGYSEPGYYDPISYNDGYYVEDIGLTQLTTSSLGGFVSQLFGELLAIGYNQGYQDAQYAAAQSGYDEVVYSDPYDPYVYVEDEAIFEDVGYDPYSCLAQNRRYVSEGYELGFRDALEGQTEYDPYAGVANVDLVSVMISAVL